jgi:hypothetical protein
MGNTVVNITDNELKLKEEIKDLREKVSIAYVNGFKNGEIYARDNCSLKLERMFYAGYDLHTIIAAIRSQEIEQ